MIISGLKLILFHLIADFFALPFMADLGAVVWGCEVGLWLTNCLEGPHAEVRLISLCVPSASSKHVTAWSIFSTFSLSSSPVELQL